MPWAVVDSILFVKKVSSVRFKLWRMNDTGFPRSTLGSMLTIG